MAMQRRQFIELSAVGGTVFLVTGLNCRQRHTDLYDVLGQPEQLAQICDLKTLREIGMDYRMKTSAEMESSKLAELLMSDSTGRVSSTADQSLVQSLMRRKTTEDFETGNIVEVKGWILSVTEARQCALLYVNNP
jgi:hypothetical protein